MAEVARRMPLSAEVAMRNSWEVAMSPLEVAEMMVEVMTVEAMTVAVRMVVVRMAAATREVSWEMIPLGIPLETGMTTRSLVMVVKSHPGTEHYQKTLFVS